MTFSVCIYCGHSKKKPLVKCEFCGKTPQESDLDMARSIILSTSSDDNGEPFNTKDELLRIGDRISRGSNYSYNQEALDCLLKQKKLLDQNSGIQWGFLFFGFCFLVVPIIALVMFFTKHF